MQGQHYLQPNNFISSNVLRSKSFTRKSLSIYAPNPSEKGKMQNECNNGLNWVHFCKQVTVKSKHLALHRNATLHSDQYRWSIWGSQSALQILSFYGLYKRWPIVWNMWPVSVHTKFLSCVVIRSQYQFRSVTMELNKSRINHPWCSWCKSCINETETLLNVKLWHHDFPL